MIGILEALGIVGTKANRKGKKRRRLGGDYTAPCHNIQCSDQAHWIYDKQNRRLGAAGMARRQLWQG